MSGSAVGLMEAGSGCSKIDDDVLPYSHGHGGLARGWPGLASAVLAARGGWSTTKAGTTYAKVGMGRWGVWAKATLKIQNPRTLGRRCRLQLTVVPCMCCLGRRPRRGGGLGGVCVHTLGTCFTKHSGVPVMTGLNMNMNDDEVCHCHCHLFMPGRASRACQPYPDKGVPAPGRGQARDCCCCFFLVPRAGNHAHRFTGMGLQREQSQSLCLNSQTFSFVSDCRRLS